MKTMVISCARIRKDASLELPPTRLHDYPKRLHDYPKRLHELLQFNFYGTHGQQCCCSFGDCSCTTVRTMAGDDESDRRHCPCARTRRPGGGDFHILHVHVHVHLNIDIDILWSCRLVGLAGVWSSALVGWLDASGGAQCGRSVAGLWRWRPGLPGASMGSASIRRASVIGCSWDTAGKVYAVAVRADGRELAAQWRTGWQCSPVGAGQRRECLGAGRSRATGQLGGHQRRRRLASLGRAACGCGPVRPGCCYAAGRHTPIWCTRWRSVPMGNWLLSGSADRKARLWHRESGDQVHSLMGHGDQVRPVAFSPDGELLASGGHDRSVRVWSRRNGDCVRSLLGHTDYVLSAGLRPRQPRIGQRLVPTAPFDAGA
jgi:hypothetical protein